MSADASPTATATKSLAADLAVNGPAAAFSNGDPSAQTMLFMNAKLLEMVFNKNWPTNKQRVHDELKRLRALADEYEKDDVVSELLSLLSKTNEAWAPYVHVFYVVHRKQIINEQPRADAVRRGEFTALLTTDKKKHVPYNAPLFEFLIHAVSTDGEFKRDLVAFMKANAANFCDHEFYAAICSICDLDPTETLRANNETPLEPRPELAVAATE